MLIKPEIERKPVIQKGDLIIDPQCFLVRLNGKAIDLYPKEFDVLFLLTQYPGWVLSIEQIYEAVWKGEAHDCEYVVYNTICQIRKKLNHPKMIETVINRGYKFVGLVLCQDFGLTKCKEIS